MLKRISDIAVAVICTSLIVVEQILRMPDQEDPLL